MAPHGARVRAPALAPVTLPCTVHTPGGPKRQRAHAGMIVTDLFVRGVRSGLLQASFRGPHGGVFVRACFGPRDVCGLGNACCARPMSQWRQRHVWPSLVWCALSLVLCPGVMHLLPYPGVSVYFLSHQTPLHLASAFYIWSRW